MPIRPTSEVCSRVFEQMVDWDEAALMSTAISIGYLLAESTGNKVLVARSSVEQGKEDIVLIFARGDYALALEEFLRSKGIQLGESQ